MRKTPFDLDLYISDVDLGKAVGNYQAMRHSLYSMQVALARKAVGTHAFSLCWAANYLLREIITSMPDNIIEEWARLDRMTLTAITEEQPGG